MKEIKIAILLLLSCLSFTYAQDLMKVQKLDSPFRLLRGVVLKNDFRMIASIPFEIEFIEHNGNEAFHLGNSHQNSVIDNHSLNPTLFLGRIIIIDGAIINDKSQVLSPVQFPLTSFSGPNRF